MLKILAIEKDDYLEADQISKPEIYNLRNRKVYSTMLVSHTQNKCSTHTNYSNLSIKKLQGIMTREGYNATKKALRSHAAICDLQQCYICTFNVEAKSYKYCPTNISNTSLVENDVLTKPLNRQRKLLALLKTLFFTFKQTAHC